MGDWVRGVNRLRGAARVDFPFPGKGFRLLDPVAVDPADRVPDPRPRCATPADDGVPSYLRSTAPGPRASPPWPTRPSTPRASRRSALPTETVTAPLIARLAARTAGPGPARSRTSTSSSPTGSRTHPHAKAITSIPGFGPILGRRSCSPTPAATCSGRSAPGPARRLRRARPRAPRFRTRQGQPAPARSATTAVCAGCSTSPRSPRSGPTGPSKTFYQRKRAEGKMHTQALIALARRLVDVIWALIRDNREFQPSQP